ncbi:MAG: trypsin-like serine protease [Parvularculaceae bacterium]|nr:trypsin-like serine protease [Parvularculaceae bacterium]
MKKMIGALAALTGLALSTQPASAITAGGDPDAGEHPYVGLMVAFDADGGGWRCSGALISPTMFVTAGHCTFGAATVNVWFEEDVGAGRPGNGYPFGGGTSVSGTAYTHPEYDDAAFFLHDLGVVILDEEVFMPTYASLPTLGLLDEFANMRGPDYPTMEAVGYGLQDIQPIVVSNLVRMKALTNVIGIRGVFGAPDGTSIKLSNNHNTGGTCFGDSGGPEFYRGSTTIGAVTSFGVNGNCAGTGGGYRIDQPDDLDWLYSNLFADHVN